MLPLVFDEMTGHKRPEKEFVSLPESVVGGKRKDGEQITSQVFCGLSRVCEQGICENG